MRIKVQLFTFLVLLLISIPVLAQKTENNDTDGNAGIIYGKDHAYSLKAPKGWILDNRAGMGQGIPAVFYPRGSSWQEGVAVMYASVWYKDKPTMTVEDVINGDIAKFKENVPKLKVEDAGSISLEKGKTAFIRHFTSDANGQNYEAIAYIGEEKVVIMLVLTSRTKKDFESSLPAFRELVGSYVFFTDKVIIKN